MFFDKLERLTLQLSVNLLIYLFGKMFILFLLVRGRRGGGERR